MTERKLKKRLQKEADTLLQAKKEEMISFYQPAGEKRTRGHRFPVRALIAASLTVILLAVGVFAVSFSSSHPAVDPSTPGSVASSESPSVSDTKSMYVNEDIMPGIIDLDDPFAIVEIEEVTEETVILGSYFVARDNMYTKIKCKVLFSYIPKGFSIRVKYGDGWKASDASNYVPFDELQEIYIISEFAAALNPNDVIFFQPEEMRRGDRIYYGPVTNTDGQAEFLPFVDGKLVIPEGMSFCSLEFANSEIQHILEYGSEYLHPELFEACPKYIFDEGLDVQQVIDFFNSCEAFRETFESLGEKRPDCCVIYEKSFPFEEDD